MSEIASKIASKIWNLCHPLRDVGLSCWEYIEQLSYLIFFKITDELSESPYKRKNNLPERCQWKNLKNLLGIDLRQKYEEALDELSKKETGILKEIFKKAENKIKDPTILKVIIQGIDEEKWMCLRAEVKGGIYESWLLKNAEDVKSGAGQYFTPRILIEAIVECVRPESMKTIADPCCGTGGFFIAAQDFIKKNYKDLDRDANKFLKNGAFFGTEIVPQAYKMCLMNLYMHNIGELNSAPSVNLGDSLSKDPEYKVHYVLTNPPFGVKSSLIYVNESGEKEINSLSVERENFWKETRNKQLSFIQHIYELLEESSGKATIVVPDNVLFEKSAGEIRKKLLENTDLHTILRLPQGIFYGTGVRASVIFFNKTSSDVEEDYKTKNIWIYDLRTNKKFSTKKNPLKKEDLQDFINCYNNREGNKETWSPENPGGRWRKFNIQEILKREGINLDIFWIKDEKTLDIDNLPHPSDLTDKMLVKLEEITNILKEIKSSCPKAKN